MVEYIERLFEYRAAGLLKELLGVLFTPFLLLISLPKASDQIVDFICDHSIVSINVGDVCDLSTFPVIKYFSASENENTVIHNGKLENSFISFIHEYKTTEVEKEYIDKLSMYRSTVSNDQIVDDNLLNLDLHELMSLNESFLGDIQHENNTIRRSTMSFRDLDFS